jgi:hypothetical protein
VSGEDALERALRATQTGYEQALAQIGLLYVNQVRVILSQPGTGRLYRRGNVTHQASAPGQAPAVDTGAYRASWTFALQGPDTVAMYPGPSPHPTHLGTWLEFGTSRMAPRPHARVAAAQIEPLIARIVETAVLRAQGGT